MYARVVRSSTAPERRTELEQIVIAQVIPALRDELGFAGALSFVDPESGDSMLIVLWRTAEDAQRPRAWHTRGARDAFLRLDAFSTERGERVSVWEVDLRV